MVRSSFPRVRIDNARRILLPLVELEGIAFFLYDRYQAQAQTAARRVMDENPGYSKDFTPERFVYAAVGYAMYSVCCEERIPDTIDELMVMNDIQKFGIEFIKEVRKVLDTRRRKRYH